MANEIEVAASAQWLIRRIQRENGSCRHQCNPATAYRNSLKVEICTMKALALSANYNNYQRMAAKLLWRY